MQKKLLGLFVSLKNWISKLSRRRKILILIVLGIFLFLISRKSVPKVETFKVTRGEITEVVSSSGEVDAGQKADLTFQSSGRLSWVGVKEGDKVKRGQGIASLDTASLNSTYQQAINSYRSYEAAAQKAEDDVKNHSSDETFTQKSTRMTAQVARDNAYDAMKAAETALKFATITAPFDGVITSASPAYAGSNVTYASAIYSLVNPDTFYFNTEVNEADVSKIMVGQKVILRLDAFPEREFESSVTEIGLTSITTSTGGTAYKVKVTLPKTEGVEFRLGMNGDVEIVVNTLSDVLYVPADAVVEEDAGNFVWVVNGSGKVKKTKVEIGTSSIDDNQIKDGLKEGEVVIIRPPSTIKNGSKVKF